MRKRNSTLAVERVREAFSYNKRTGVLTWRIKRRGHIKIGDAVGCLKRNGYLMTCLDGNPVMVHRVIWLHVTGVWPVGDIDHKNRKPADNRWVNLRDVSHSLNGHNTALRKHNTSGFKGVDWCKREQLWRARINVESVSHPLGYFKHKSQAIAARKAAEERFKTNA